MEIKTKERFKHEREKMKSAHQAEAAYKTEYHTRTKQIWVEAVLTCVSKRSLRNRPRPEQPNGSVQSVHISPTWNVIVSKPGLPACMYAVAYRVQMKSHFATDCNKSYFFH